jgi:pentalenene oxygenase
VRIRIGPYSAVVVCAPALTRHTLVNDRVFERGGFFFERVRELVGDGLAACPYRQHRSQRRLVQPAFHHSRLPVYARAMTEQIDMATTSWTDGQVIDVQDEI